MTTTIEVEKIKNTQIKEEMKLVSDVRDYLIDKEFNKNLILLEIEKIAVNTRAQFIYDIIQVDYDWFITLTFCDKKSEDEYDDVALKIRKLIDMLSSCIYGKRSKKRVIHYTVIERDKEKDLHAHILIKDPNELDKNGHPIMIKDLVHYFWAELTGTILDNSEIRKKKSKRKNKEWIKRICENGILGVAEYITKQCYKYRDAIIYDLCCLNGRKLKTPK